MVSLAKQLALLKKAKIVVIGDLLLDRYTVGQAYRISPEAPVPIIQAKKETSLPGGAGNVALNLTALGADVFLLGRVGKDFAGETLVTYLNKEGIETRGIFSHPSYSTPVKHRIIAANQQIVRIDYEEIETLNEIEEEKLIQNFKSLLQENIQAVAISDYAKGLLTPRVLKEIFEYSKQKNIPVVTDPKGKDFEKYRGTTIIKPNENEAYAAANLSVGTEISVVANSILKQTDSEFVMITRAEKGISLLNKAGLICHFPVPIKEVKDVTGAGDTVLAILTLAIANKVECFDAINLCNIAAGLAIDHIGCARITINDLYHHIVKNSIEVNKTVNESQMFIFKNMLNKSPSLTSHSAF